MRYPGVSRDNLRFGVRKADFFLKQTSSKGAFNHHHCEHRAFGTEVPGDITCHQKKSPKKAVPWPPKKGLESVNTVFVTLHSGPNFKLLALIIKIFMKFNHSKIIQLFFYYTDFQEVKNT